MVEDRAARSSTTNFVQGYPPKTSCRHQQPRLQGR
jgi:hypothetical protein